MTRDTQPVLLISKITFTHCNDRKHILRKQPRMYKLEKNKHILTQGSK